MWLGRSWRSWTRARYDSYAEIVRDLRERAANKQW
jgi:hypothetical protein